MWVCCPYILACLLHRQSGSDPVTRRSAGQRLPLPHQPLLEATLLRFISFRVFVSANNKWNWSLGMVEHLQCYKQCAGCNSTPGEALKAPRPWQEAILLLSFLFLSPPPPPPSFESLNLTKAAQTQSLCWSRRGVWKETRHLCGVTAHPRTWRAAALG